MRAGVDGDVVLGAENHATTRTNIINFDSNAGVLYVESAADVGNGGGIAVAGISGSSTGIFGQSTSGVGVQGTSASSIGVVGLSTASSGATFGAFGRSDSSGGIGVGGRGYANTTGVLGYSGSGTFPASKPKTGVFGYAAQDANSVGVRGESPAGFGIYGKTTGTGFAGYFNGKTFMSQFVEIAEMSTPTAPGGNRARLFVRDNGASKTQLCVRFPTGVVKVLATEP